MKRPTIFQKLRADHRRVLQNIAAVDLGLKSSSGRRSTRGATRGAASARRAARFVEVRRLLAGLSHQFATHMVAEDELLFPALAAALPEASPGIEPLSADHRELRAWLASLIALLDRPGSPARDEAIHVQWSDFSELLRIHIRKEETLVFNIAEHVLPPRELRQIEARRFPKRGPVRAPLSTRKTKGSSTMKRALSLLLLVGLAGLAVSCGGKSTSADSAGGSGGTPAAAAGTASGGLATVSKFDGGPRAGESPVNPEMAKLGEKLFSSKGCSACHGFGKKLTGPDLQGVSMRRTAAWIENQILHPDVMVKEDPISHELFAKFALQMPKQGLTPEESHAVIEYFKHLDHAAGLTRPVSHQ